MQLSRLPDLDIDVDEYELAADDDVVEIGADDRDDLTVDVAAGDDADEVELAIEIGIDPDALDGEIVRRLTRGDVEVPPFPQVVLQLHQLQARDAGLSAWVDVVARDPALAARCLRAANAASFTRAERVTTLAQAVSTVGTQMLLRVALADGLASAVGVDGPLVILRDAAWRRAVASALLSSALAPLRALPPDEVFVCALLHDFGRLLAVRLIENIVADHALPFLDEVAVGSWDEVIDRYRHELGILAAHRWGLPEAIKSVIAVDPQRLGGHPRADLLQLVHGVDRVIALLDRQSEVDLDDVVSASGFGIRDADVLLRALPALPALISSFTIERLGAVRPGGVAAMPTAAGAAKAVTATTVGMTQVRSFKVHELSARGVVLIGSAGLATQQVFHLRFERPTSTGSVVVDRPLSVWMRVLATQQVGVSWQVLATPFALSGEDLLRWQAWTRSMATR